jgi:hypothetical protein
MPQLVRNPDVLNCEFQPRRSQLFQRPKTFGKRDRKATLLVRLFRTSPFSNATLTIAAIPFIARVVEAAIREVDQGLVEAARAFGASPLRQIATHHGQINQRLHRAPTGSRGGSARPRWILRR